jgi:DNA-binding beta-propeller fold protein YncE
MRFTYVLAFFALFSCSEKAADPLHLSKSIVVANGGDNSLSVLDPASYTEKHRIYLKAPQATYLHHLDLSPDKKSLALAFPEYDFSGGHDGLHGLDVKGYVSLFNIELQDITRTVQVPYANHNAVFSQDGKEVWTSLVSHSGRVLVHRTDNGALLASITVGADPHEILLMAEGRYVVVSCMESSFLTVIDTESKKVVRDIKVDPFPSNVWKGQDSYTVIVENSNQKTLNFVDLNSLSVKDHIDLDFAPGFTGYDPEGRLWICAKGQDFLYRFEKINGEWKSTLKIPTEKDPHQFLFHDDKLWLIHQKQNTVAIIDRQSGEKTQSINVGLKPNALLYIP